VGEKKEKSIPPPYFKSSLQHCTDTPGQSNEKQGLNVHLSIVPGSTLELMIKTRRDSFEERFTGWKKSSKSLDVL